MGSIGGTDGFVSRRPWGRLAICGRLAIGQASAARPLGWSLVSLRLCCLVGQTLSSVNPVVSESLRFCGAGGVPSGPACQPIFFAASDQSPGAGPFWESRFPARASGRGNPTGAKITRSTSTFAGYLIGA
jgi:hypothetical protein